MPLLDVRWLGLVPYADAARLQEQLVQSRRRGEVPDTLLLLEHPATITLGRSSRPQHLLVSRDEARRRGIEVHEAGRGGDVTYHGPGQLVGYPIVALEGANRDAHGYLRRLEDALVSTVATFGVAARPLPGLTGIWVGDRKLGAIGVRLSTAWIASHGFALNVATDLAGFGAIVPCGIRDRGVTSLLELTGRELSCEEVAPVAAAAVARALGLEKAAA